MKVTAVLVLALLAVATARPLVVGKLNLQAIGAGGPYEDPNKGPCASDEEAIRIQGVPGSICAPHCNSTTACPAAGSGSAQAECAIEVQGQSQPTLCALICQPGSSTCVTGATCEPIQGVGICTYTS
eukprot:TRINITY_DN4787_c0_g2_i1.p1 TRINITY_DN4787_c0_g2~~TRINITY_DN4787_c0_g2_i1.p1  ORF type:complete len:141 (-),score=15.64 TRINITY_DN4787_c0_g2_i1:118-498(-)